MAAMRYRPNLSAQWLWVTKSKTWRLSLWKPGEPRYLGHVLNVDTCAPLDDWGISKVESAIVAEMESWLPWA